MAESDVPFAKAYAHAGMVAYDGEKMPKSKGNLVRPQDILKYLAESFPEELLNLPPRPHQQMKKPEGG